jgi:hypothetical protein
MGFAERFLARPRTEISGLSNHNDHFETNEKRIILKRPVSPTIDGNKNKLDETKKNHEKSPNTESRKSLNVAEASE